MKLCDKELCTGCLACYSSCSSCAIIIDTDEEGFYGPKILEDLCVDCGKCTLVCPILKQTQNESKYLRRKAYAAWSKNKLIRKESSSGGLFTELAIEVIRENGKVFGAAFNEDLKVVHKMVDNEESLSSLRGSKYVQSFIGDTFNHIKGLIKENKLVLFVGTPCQVAGLNTAVGQHEKLITIDLICHGTPSPLVFKKYIEWLEFKYQSKIENFKFRDKRKSWQWFNIKAIFKSGKIYNGSWFGDPFLRAFLREYTLKTSCYKCQFTRPYRQGDITLADFWGWEKTCKEEKNTDEGISMVIINSAKGENIFNKVKANLIFYQHPLEKVLKSQRSLQDSWPVPHDRSEFWSDFNSKDFELCVQKWMYPQKRNFAEYLLSTLGKNEMVVLLSFLYNKYYGARKRVYKLLNK